MLTLYVLPSNSCVGNGLMRHSALRLDIIYTSIRDKIITHCKDNKESGGGGGLKCKVRRIFITCKMPKYKDRILKI